MITVLVSGSRPICRKLEVSASADWAAGKASIALDCPCQVFLREIRRVHTEAFGIYVMVALPTI